MKNLLLLSATTLLCLSTSDLIAWEKKAKSTCEKKEDSCKRDIDSCKKRCEERRKKCTRDTDSCKQENSDCVDKCKEKSTKCDENNTACKKEIPQSDESSFKSAMGYRARMKYNKFTPEQKTKAMDLADNNKMTPDEAVNKVAGK